MELTSMQFPWLEARTILLVRAGSHAYGTNVEGSDEDIRGIAIPPVNYLLGYSRQFEQTSVVLPGTKKPDTVIYGIQKFFDMAAEGQNNAIEMLFTAPEDRLFTHPLAEELLAVRNEFLTMRVVYGYFAKAQALQMDWANTSNPETAMDMVRCYRVTKRLLEGLEPEVKRVDAAELLNILDGGWHNQDLLDYSALANTEIDSKLAGMRVSGKYPWPDSVDANLLDWFCASMIEGSFEFLVNMPVFGEWKQEPLGFAHGTLKDKFVGWEK